MWKIKKGTKGVCPHLFLNSCATKEKTKNLLFLKNYYSIIKLDFIGGNKWRRLNPSTNVSFLLEQTNQALGLIYKKGSLPLSSIPNIDIAIKNLESNFSLTALDLLEIGSILKTSRELKEYFLDETCDLILPSCDLLYINKLLEKEIFDKILDENTISDNASSKLNSIRKSQKNLGVEIKNKLIVGDTIEIIIPNKLQPHPM